ncbi:MAG: hypothetical protein IKF38_04885 [Clostridia bacterium]|nr:hypothetical protein [Clostridia bacterium]
MNKTIKIIDLLVRMHKKENLPRKIEISGEEYLYDNISETYVSTLNNQYLGHEISLDFCLNDKVVIIEEQEEIDIQNLKELTKYEDMSDYDGRDIDINRNLINQLVQAVKRLDKEKEDKK